MPLERKKEGKTSHIHMLVLTSRESSINGFVTCSPPKYLGPSQKKLQTYRPRKPFAADKTLFTTNPIVEMVLRPGNAS
jgi:hypothetical protein